MKLVGIKFRKVVTFLCLLCAIQMNAGLERNYIYLLDCTKSMVGYNGTPNIWESTKSYLANDLTRLDATCSWSIVLFNDKVYETYSGNDGREASQLWNKTIEDKCNELVQNVTNTNICDTWKTGLSLCSDNKYNYIYLLTDGIDNMPNGGPQKLGKLMRDFCGTSKYTHVYYVMLTKNAKNQSIIDVVDLCDNIHIVDASDGPVKPFCHLEQNEVNINTHELNKSKTIGFGLAGNYSASLNCNDPYFDVKIKNNTIKNNTIEFEFTQKRELFDEFYQFDVDLHVNGVDILNNPIVINVTNRPEKNIDVKGGVNIGEATYIEPFAIFEGRMCDTLNVDLGIVYNKYAQSYNSKASFKVVPDEDIDEVDYEVWFNGEKCEDEIINVTPNKNNLSIIFMPDAETGKRFFYLKLVDSHKLDKINGNPISNYKTNDIENELQLIAYYNTDWHWLKTFLVWLGIVIIILIVFWFIFLRPIFVKKFKRSGVVIMDPYYKNIRIHKAVKVKFTNKPKASQNIFSRLFIGKIVYEKNPIWIDEIELVPTMKGECQLSTKGKYAVSPFTSPLIVGEEYDLVNNNTEEKIKITII